MARNGRGGVRHGLVIAVLLALLAYASGVSVRDGSVAELAVAGSEGDKSRAGVSSGSRVQGQAGEKLTAGVSVRDSSLAALAVAGSESVTGGWSTIDKMREKYKLTDGTIMQAVTDWCSGGSKRVDVEKRFFPISVWDVSRVTVMNHLFYAKHTCNPPIGSWNTAKVINMESMFFGASAFNQPIGKWNTAAVTRMGYMFLNASAFNQPIGSWNTSAVTRMSEMFHRANAFNQPIGSWNTSAVTDMGYMFLNSAFNQPIGNWNGKSRALLLGRRPRFATACRV
jgi:surface protein